ncbi:MULTISPECIES: macro domain-containing protein [unclassified Vibrio]|uniref:macro domain-containing protein n=1 Tax=unclassified Vibrio TaxID=2614977 RepID=UPI0009EEC410|nr:MULTISPECIES: macro domain-containing protein [unclassified Vibrio]
MSINYIKGNIFTSTAEVLVNPVNCVGIMGAGLALEFRLRYPDMFNKYADICERKLLSPGKLWVFNGGDRRILNFPTKIDWKAKTEKDFLIQGLLKFVDTYEEKCISSIAFPLLGADRGGLDKNISLKVMKEFLEPLKIDIEIYEYLSTAHDDLFEDFKDVLLTNRLEDISLKTGVKINILERIYVEIKSKPYYQVNQLLSISGVGVASLEKVFQFYKVDTDRECQRNLF